MHIAICMDVAADRKQLERLLGRSTDARLAADDTIPFYIQSYGNKEALLNRPFMYDLFFIDLLNDTMDSIQLIHELRDMGVSSTIVLCPGKVDLRDRLTPEDECLILQQPILVKELEAIMDIAVDRVKNKAITISIRTNTDTVHLVEEELLFAKKEKDTISIHLTDGREIISTETMKNFYSRARVFEKIKPISDSMVVNTDYVETTGFASVILKDQKKYPASRSYLKKYFNS